MFRNALKVLCLKKVPLQDCLIEVGSKETSRKKNYVNTVKSTYINDECSRKRIRLI